jgi:serine kinase of HPr protein (carbohydrate metabolism regulator)
MRLDVLARQIQARVLAPGRRPEAEVTGFYAGNRMSDLLAQATDTTLLVTGLANAQLLCVAELMDAPGICLVDGGEPAPELVEAAGRAGTALLVSPAAMPELCRHLEACLNGRNQRCP